MWDRLRCFMQLRVFYVAVCPGCSSLPLCSWVLCLDGGVPVIDGTILLWCSRFNGAWQSKGKQRAPKEATLPPPPTPTPHTHILLHPCLLLPSSVASATSAVLVVSVPSPLHIIACKPQKRIQKGPMWLACLRCLLLSVVMVMAWWFMIKEAHRNPSDSTSGNKYSAAVAPLLGVSLGGT